jgi:hypothetical protein
VKIKQGANGESILTLDEAAQKRLGLAVTNPVASEWQPEIRATGRAADPLIFTVAAADYEAARAAAAASQAELERTKNLAAQENTSARTLEAAAAAAARDAFALQSARAKFTGEWGVKLAAQTNLTAIATQLQTGQYDFVKLSLPSGTFPKPLPASAKIFIFNREDDPLSGEFADDLGVAPATQTQMLLVLVKQNLPPGIAVTAALKTAGNPVGGVTIPPNAVLRHDNKGWIFVQTGATEFTRRELPLDRAMDDGFFSADLSATNLIVVTGAQSLLSAELSGGNFNSGSRD